MARKRGGLAGLYDRNKGLFRTGATIGASLLGGPLAGAATGAAFRGLDREGKRGIGFDIGQGLRGGLEGYGVGQTTKAVSSGIQGLLTAQKLNSLAPMDVASKIGLTGGGPSSLSIAPVDPSSLRAAASPFANVVPQSAATVKANTASPARLLAGNAPKVSQPTLANAPGPLNRFANLPTINRTVAASNPSAALQNAPGRFGRFANVLRENKDLLTEAGKGIQNMLPNDAAEARLMEAETGRMRFEEERRQMQLEDERRRRMAELLMPLFRERFPQYAGS